MKQTGFQVCFQMGQLVPLRIGHSHDDGELDKQQTTHTRTTETTTTALTQTGIRFLFFYIFFSFRNRASRFLRPNTLHFGDDYGPVFSLFCHPPKNKPRARGSARLLRWQKRVFVTFHTFLTPSTLVQLPPPDTYNR